MSIMIAEVYEALLEAGASESKAKAAAESLAGYENRFAKIEPDLPVIKWMVGAAIAGIISLVIRAYVI